MKHNFNTLHLGWAIRNIPKNIINGHEKSILLILLLSTGYENLSWYSLQSIADMCCFSLNTIRRNLKTLEQKKFISIIKPSVYNRTSTNQYMLNIDEIMTYSKIEKDTCEIPLSEERVPHRHVRVADRAPERVPHRATKNKTKERKEECAGAHASVEAFASRRGGKMWYDEIHEKAECEKAEKELNKK